ncbi:hypothetical protein [Rhizobium leguminosarum]|uniref:hypothetical protein n=1 Tax=Rhizobium leguminosarum TaxID=384 RepID=UPI001C93928A|nr:hypothetical protein [Rhizobium leguminosarum]MBY5439056.1 hypothetical protein [Rhizobium leguminosarum]
MTDAKRRPPQKQHTVDKLQVSLLGGFNISAEGKFSIVALVVVLGICAYLMLDLRLLWAKALSEYLAR